LRALLRKAEKYVVVEASEKFYSRYQKEREEILTQLHNS
jgi:hypothetical protein